MFDIIGDIHGHADKLKELLAKLGYVADRGTYSHPGRRALFVGDYIDRGPHIAETLRIVKGMVDAGHAIALMGNHEYNAVCFHLKDAKGGHLRRHTIRNILQHVGTLKQFLNEEKEWEAWIDWFRTLPLYYENEYFRAVHACWDPHYINLLTAAAGEGPLDDDFFVKTNERGSELFLALDATLKGKEIILPDGKHFFDKDGNKRFKQRIRWWLNPLQAPLKHISIVHMAELPDIPAGNPIHDTGYHYSEDEKPVFFGHYWRNGIPELYRHNVCCLDFSVAKGGLLAAYRYDGEKMLDNGKFVYVP